MGHQERAASPAERGRLRSVADLAARGLIVPEAAPGIEAVARRYAVGITPAMADLIDPDDPADPIARQFLPDPAELTIAPEERADPIGDTAHSALPGLVHRYPDRVLLKLLHACPVYCRFCFRREMVGPGGEAMDEAALTAALAYIRGDPAIWEAILTGGDPLMLAPRRLADLVGRLDAIPHLGVVRLHSRVPVVEPGRVTPALAEALAAADSAVWLAVHVNHPRELTSDALVALRRLARAGVSLVSQTVLLRGVNDDAAVLEALFRALLRAGVKPYYLHHGDLAPGTGHFRTSIDRGRAIMRVLRGRLSGLAQPTYVLDIPGGHGKVPIGPVYLSGSETEGWQVEAPDGSRRPYPPAA